MLGPHIIKALLNANFDVTVLTRSKRPGLVNDSVKVIEVDYNSVESLTAALKGIDGVMSTVASHAIANQTVLIDAAVAAGVKRFIPAELGSCTTNPELESISLMAPLYKIKRYLQERANDGKLTWTVYACGAFLDFLLDKSLLVDFNNHKAILLDEGDNRISATSQPTIGRAIAEIFKNFEATKNRIVKTSEIIITQNRLLRIAKDLRPDIKWELSKIPASELLKDGLDNFKPGGYAEQSGPVIMKIIMGTAFAGDKYGGVYDETDNELLGVEELTEEDLKKLVARNCHLDYD